jgi:hypothetical protein
MRRRFTRTRAWLRFSRAKSRAAQNQFCLDQSVCRLGKTRLAPDTLLGNGHCSHSQPDDQHRAWGRPDDTFGGAAERQPRQAGAPVGTNDDEFGGRRSGEVDDSLRRRSRLRQCVAIDTEADQRVLKLALSRGLQIVDRANRDPRNAVHEWEPKSCRTSRTSEGECANVDNVKKLEL